MQTPCQARRRARSGTWRMVLSWCWLLAAPALVAQVSHEYEVKAVFLLNLAQFVEWPANAFPDPRTPLTIGILGTDPFGHSLTNRVSHELVHGRKIHIAHYSRPQEVAHCQILFVSRNEAPHLGSILRRIKGQPVLTVGESEGFAQRGGIVQFHTEKDKVRLGINVEAARSARLSVSTKLLRVAEVLDAANSK